MKLTIAVQPPQTSTIDLEEDMAYRWDRIAYTLLGAAALIGIIIFVFFPGTDEPLKNSEATIERTELPLFSAEPASTPSEPDITPAVTAASDADPAPAIFADEPPREPEMMAESSAPVNAGQPDPTVEAPVMATRTTPASAVNQQAGSRTSGSTSGGLFSASRTTIHSDRIKRFSLARAVRNYEPVGTLGDITPKKGEAAVVFAHCEAENLKDETLRYIWILNGSKMATVRVPIGSNSSRSHSSKNVAASMRGDWKVELRDSQGDLLAMSEFQY